MTTNENIATSSAAALKEDLTREVEESDQESVDDDNKSTIKDEERGSSISQEQSTNLIQGPKKLRSRPNNEGQYKTPPKRRKTIDSENSEQISSVTNDDVDEPIPGPSSGKINQNQQQQSFRKDLKHLPEPEDMDYEAEGEGGPDPGANHIDDNVSTSGPFSRTITKRPKDTTEDLHLLAQNPRVFGSHGMGELFQLPTYEFEGGGEDRNRNQIHWPAVDHTREENTGVLRRSLSRDRNIHEEDDKEMKADKEAATESSRILWARKVLFMSAELVFPGVSKYANTQNLQHKYMAVRVRSSWVLQALLYADVLFFAMWFCAFLGTFDIWLSVLKELHGNLIVCMSALFSLVNIPRLIFGLKGNEHDKLEFLALFWLITFIVQVPLFGFIMFTDVFTPIRLPFTTTMDAIMMIFILLEVIIGTIHLKSLVRDELKVIELSNKAQKHFGQQDEIGADVVNAVVVNANANQNLLQREAQEQEEIAGNNGQIEDHSDDEGWSTEDEEYIGGGSRRRDLGYRMQIQELNTNESADENDDANEVTSTSDAIRHRPIRAT